MAGPHYPFADEESWQNFQSLQVELRKMRGYAVLGAGASFPLPGWLDLYGRIEARARRAGSKLPPAQDPHLLTSYFQHASNTLGKDWLLDAIRTELSTDAGLPELYVLMTTLDRFAGIHTFNYDEYLHRTAVRAGSASPSYPFNNWDRESSRFLYLHGRISTASTINDLVLCDNDYITAYNDQSPLTAAIRHLYRSPPVVFIGTSLTDYHFLHALGYLHQSLAYQAQGDASFRANMPWFAFLCDDNPDRAAIIVETRLKASGVRVIWYDCADNHDALLQALHMLQEGADEVDHTQQAPRVVLRAREARRLALVSQPSATQIRLAHRLLEDAHSRQVFFSTATSAAWLPALLEAGHLQPEEPREVEGGAVASRWPAASYMQRIVPEAASDVASFLQHLETTNWIALKDLAPIVHELSDDLFWGLADRLERWAALSVDVGLVLEVFRRIEEASEAKPWQRLLHGIALRIGDDSSRRYEAMRVGDTAKRAYVAASGLDPTVAEILLGVVRQIAAERWETPDQDGSWIVKRDLDRPERTGLSPGLDWLLTTTLAVLQGMRTDRSAYDQVLKVALHDEWPLVQRLALFELSRRSAARTGLRSSLIARLPWFLDSIPHYHEVALLARSAVRGRTAADRAIVSAIQSAVVERRAKPGNRTARWERLLADQAVEGDLYLYGEVEIFTPTPPLDAAGYHERFGHLQGADFLGPALDPSRFAIDVGWEQDNDLLWDTVAELVERENLVDVALAVTDSILESHETAAKVVSVLPKLELGYRTGEAITWLCDLATSEHLRAVHAALDSLREFANIREFPNEIQEVVLPLIRRHGSSIHQPLKWGNVWSQDREPEILMRQLNDIAGKAAQLLVDAFLADRARGRQDGEALPPWVEIFIQNQDWDYVESWVALGEVFPFIAETDAATAKRAVSKVLAEEASLLGRQAFWSGYAWRSSPYGSALEILAQAIRADVIRIDELANIGHAVRERLVAHAAIGWIQGVPGYERLPEFIFKNGTGASIDAFLQESALVLRSAGDALLIRVPSLLAEIVEADKRHALEARSRPYAHWLRRLIGLGAGTDLLVSLRHIFDVLPPSEVHSGLEYMDSIAADNPQLTLELATIHVRRVAHSMELRWDARVLLNVIRKVAPEVGDTREFDALIGTLLDADAISISDAEALLNLR